MVDDTEPDDDLVRDSDRVLTSFCARLYGRRAAKRKTGRGVEGGAMLEAVKVAPDPTPRQERLLESHAGAARFAYNAGLAHVKDMLERGDTPEWSYYALRRWWGKPEHTRHGRDHGRTMVAQEQQESYNSARIIGRRAEELPKSRKATERPQDGLPTLQIQGQGGSQIRVHDRLVWSH